MIANWQVEPVGLDGVVRSTDHDTDVVGVRVGRVKVRVVSHKDRHVHLGLSGGEHAGGLKLLGQLGATLGKDCLDGTAHLDTGCLAKLHELVECGLAEDVMVHVRHDGAFAEQTFVLKYAQINDEVADARAAVHLLLTWVHEGAKRDVLQGELIVSRVLDPTLQRSFLCVNHLSKSYL